MLAGIDMSNNNPDPIDWPLVAKSQEFVFLKITEGTGFVDPLTPARWSAGRAVGLLVGGYHFARPSLNSPEAEAAYFLRHLPSPRPGDMVALDIEEDGTTADQSVWALAWMRAVGHALGFSPLLYSYPDYIRRWLTAPALGSAPLWLANYDPAATPRPWTTATIRQYTDAGAVPGIEGAVDMDETPRTRVQLAALGKPAPAQPSHYHVTQPGALKTMPDHASAPVRGPRGSAIFLDQGTDVHPTGGTYRDDQGASWFVIQVVNPPARGWFLAASIAPGI